jgi:hypothetical protein
MRILIIAAASLALAFTPAFAKTKPKATATACSGENMAKTSAAMSTMPEGPGKMAMSKEMGKVNTEMSKGNMRAACASYMKAQKMSSAK